MTRAMPRGFYIIFSLPKSGAQAFASALDAGYLPEPFGKSYPPSMSNMNGLHVEVQISRAFAAHYPDGGWLHTHAPFSFVSADAMATMGSKYLVVVRNPLDQLAAYYCHVMKHLAHHGRVPGHPDLIYAVPMARCRRDVFAEQGKLSEAFTHLIRDGYLDACLRWIADWLFFRDKRRSRVVRYEDFVQSPARVLFEAQGLLHDSISFDGDRLAQALDSLRAYRHKSYEKLDNPSTFYPRGWTGSVGVRSQYLSPEQEEEAIGAVERFCRTYPHGACLADIYPEFLNRPRH